MIRYAFTKVGMTSSFDKQGQALGVTVLKFTPAKIIRLETTENGKKVAIIEYDTGFRKKISKGWVVSDFSQLRLGDLLFPSNFSDGQKIKITGLSKGRGFQDVVTKYGFAGGPASHGSRFHRSPGSVGMRTEPGRVMKGKKMPGQDGCDQITLKNVSVVYWSKDEQLIAVVGGVPGARGSVVFI